MFTIRERIIHKIKNNTNALFSDYRRKKLNNTDFTIISNNCWGGICYEYFGLPKQSPTVGCYFYAQDFIKFISNLPHYLNLPLEIIDAQYSKHYESLKEKKQLDIPIGLLGDVEIVFLHYKDAKIAKEKWERRTKRVNYSNVIIKFSYMNECDDTILEEFKNIRGIKKICFVGGNLKNEDSIFYLPYYSEKTISDDTFYWNKYIDIVDIINKPTTPISNLFHK